MFELLCPSSHEKLIYGKCPWCGSTIIDGRNLLTVMCEARISSFMTQPLNERHAKVVLPHLLAALRQANPAFRMAAVTILGQLGAYAEDALPALSNLLHDEDQFVREAVEEAIKNIEK